MHSEEPPLQIQEAEFYPTMAIPKTGIQHHAGEWQAVYGD